MGHENDSLLLLQMVFSVKMQCTHSLHQSVMLEVMQAGRIIGTSNGESCRSPGDQQWGWHGRQRRQSGGGFVQKSSQHWQSEEQMENMAALNHGDGTNQQ